MLQRQGFSCRICKVTHPSEPRLGPTLLSPTAADRDLLSGDRPSHETLRQLRRETESLPSSQNDIRCANEERICCRLLIDLLPLQTWRIMASKKICTCKICTCGTHNCPRWPAWKLQDPLKMSVIPFCEGGKIGNNTEYVDEYVPKPVHPPPPDDPKQFRYAHPRQTTYIDHYPWKCPADHPYVYKWYPEKSLFKGVSTYTTSYTPPPQCPICPVAPFLSKKTTIDKMGHRIYD